MNLKKKFVQVDDRVSNEIRTNEGARNGVPGCPSSNNIYYVIRSGRVSRPKTIKSDNM